mmetsp:Transcript_107632/g.299837  ORF Transcript_107632/g.299837 Transcript_107632/m.299837 type:complete len:205 (-) Transcript_107632:786-1400(-)
MRFSAADCLLAKLTTIPRAASLRRPLFSTSSTQWARATEPRGPSAPTRIEIPRSCVGAAGPGRSAPGSVMPLSHCLLNTSQTAGSGLSVSTGREPRYSAPKKTCTPSNRQALKSSICSSPMPMCKKSGSEPKESSGGSRTFAPQPLRSSPHQGHKCRRLIRSKLLRRSSTTTSAPNRCSSSAHLRPTGPAPTTTAWCFWSGRPQ